MNVFSFFGVPLLLISEFLRFIADESKNTKIYAPNLSLCTLTNPKIRFLLMSTETGDLYTLRAQLQTIYDSISRFQPPPKRLPILDSSLYFKDEKDQGPWIQHENIPGLKKLKETVKIDLDALDKVCILL